MAEQRERQEPMRDGGAKGRFPLGAIGIEMDPLAIFSGFGKLADAVLGDFKPICDADFAPHKISESIEIFDHQSRHRIVLSLSRYIGSAGIEQHVSHKRRAELIAVRVGQVNASDTES
jgi:hypothetical protein